MDRSRRKATSVVDMVQGIRMELPRIGTRKLYHMLYPLLKEKKAGRDRLFDILRANHLLISPKRSYHVTTNSRHRFRKHKNLVEGIEPARVAFFRFAVKA